MDQQEILSDFANRRKHDRLDRCFVLRYSTFHEASDRPVNEGRLLDIGGGGLRFIAKERFDKDCQLVLEIKIPGWLLVNDDWVQTRQAQDICLLKIVGTVMWTRQILEPDAHFETGLRFTGQIR